MMIFTQDYLQNSFYKRISAICPYEFLYKLSKTLAAAEIETESSFEICFVSSVFPKSPERSHGFELVRLISYLKKEAAPIY